MKRLILVLVLCMTGIAVQAQSSDKQHRKKNMVVKEWLTRAGSTKPELDHTTTYDTLGRKIEEIEYSSKSQKKRIVYEYAGKSRKPSREIVYNEKNNVTRIKKIEYDSNGNKTRQLNYKPNGKLHTTKTFEYSYR